MTRRLLGPGHLLGSGQICRYLKVLTTFETYYSEVPNKWACSMPLYLLISLEKSTIPALISKKFPP